jgi:hypothetical protein
MGFCGAAALRRVELLLVLSPPLPPLLAESGETGESAGGGGGGVSSEGP